MAVALNERLDLDKLRLVYPLGTLAVTLIDIHTRGVTIQNLLFRVDYFSRYGPAKEGH
jgi:hypothetical protein